LEFFWYPGKFLVEVKPKEGAKRAAMIGTNRIFILVFLSYNFWMMLILFSEKQITL
jgi:hypothetical protein